MSPNKLLFFFRRPKAVIIAGNDREAAKEAIFQVLNRYFKVGREIFVIEDTKESGFFLKKSSLPILVSTRLGEYHPDREFFTGEISQASETAGLAKRLPAHSYLILNFDDETVRDIKNQSMAHPVTFGFGMRSDIRATDVVLTRFPAPGTNFKINHGGSIVPIWLESLFGKDYVYAALAAAAVGSVLGLNLVQISEALKNYNGLPGKMRLIGGIKKSLILDDSENASSLSMLESLEILKKIEGVGRKIAVLGDIIGVGKYAIEAHEAMGGEIKASADVLITVGERAKFFGQGAKIKGMADDKIFQFGDTVSAGKFLQEEIKEGNLILVDGSKEMNMINIVEEIKAGPIV